MYGSDETLLEGDQRRKIWYSKDDHTGLITLRTEYNNDTGMALAAEARKNDVMGFKPKKNPNDGTREDAHHYAHIPDAIILLELVPLGLASPDGKKIIDMKGVLKWLNKSENEVFRIKPGVRHTL